MGYYRHPYYTHRGVLHSFSVKNIFYDKMDLRLFYFCMTLSLHFQDGFEKFYLPLIFSKQLTLMVFLCQCWKIAWLSSHSSWKWLSLPDWWILLNFLCNNKDLRKGNQWKTFYLNTSINTNVFLIFSMVSGLPDLLWIFGLLRLTKSPKLLTSLAPFWC